MLVPEFTAPADAIAALSKPAPTELMVVQTEYSEAALVLRQLEKALAVRFGALNREGDPVFTYGDKNSPFANIEDFWKRSQNTHPTGFFAFIEPVAEDAPMATAEYMVPLLRGKGAFMKFAYEARELKLHGGTMMNKLTKNVVSKRIDEDPWHAPVPPTSPTEVVPTVSERSMRYGAILGRGRNLNGYR